MKLKVEMDVKKKKLEEVKKVKEKKLKETKKLCQSSMLQFTSKVLPIDPIKKKRIEEAIIKYVVVENAFNTMSKMATLIMHHHKLKIH